MKEEEKKEQEEQEQQNKNQNQNDELTDEQIEQALRDREEEASNREGKGEDEQEKDEEDEEQQQQQEEEPKEEPKKERGLTKEEIDNIVAERIKPILEKEENRVKSERTKARQVFFTKHPEYLRDSEQWQKLLDELEAFNPQRVESDYGNYLEKAHRLLGGVPISEEEAQNRLDELATDTSGSRAGYVKSISGGKKLSSADKQLAKDWGVSDETMEKFEEKSQRMPDGSIMLFHEH